jgi:hypothetical protein
LIKKAAEACNDLSSNIEHLKTQTSGRPAYVRPSTLRANRKRLIHDQRLRLLIENQDRNDFSKLNAEQIRNSVNQLHQSLAKLAKDNNEKLQKLLKLHENLQGAIKRNSQMLYDMAAI